MPPSSEGVDVSIEKERKVRKRAGIVDDLAVPQGFAGLSYGKRPLSVRQGKLALPRCAQKRFEKSQLFIEPFGPRLPPSVHTAQIPSIASLVSGPRLINRGY
jgi:hypothetical protein